MCRGVLRHLTTISAPLMVCVAGARPLLLPRLYPVHGAASSFLRPTISVQERYSSAPGTACCDAQSAIVRSVQHRSCECDSSRQRAVGGRFAPHHDAIELSQGRSDYKGQNSFVTPRRRPRASAFFAPFPGLAYDTVRYRTRTLLPIRKCRSTRMHIRIGWAFTPIIMAFLDRRYYTAPRPSPHPTASPCRQRRPSPG
jgi:hypothetical protein